MYSHEPVPVFKIIENYTESAILNWLDEQYPDQAPFIVQERDKQDIVTGHVVIVVNNRYHSQEMFVVRFEPKALLVRAPNPIAKEVAEYNRIIKSVTVAK
jgi:hypothetical protein